MSSSKSIPTASYSTKLPAIAYDKSCWNPLIMANILYVLNSVMKGEKRKEKSPEPGAQIFCRSKQEKNGMALQETIIHPKSWL